MYFLSTYFYILRSRGLVVKGHERSKRTNDGRSWKRGLQTVEGREGRHEGMTSALKQIVENSLRFDDDDEDDDSVIDKVRPFVPCLFLHSTMDGRMGLLVRSRVRSLVVRCSRGLTKCRFLPSFVLPTFADEEDFFGWAGMVVQHSLIRARCWLKN